MEVKRYPVDAKDYNLYEEVGEGVSASVHRALCIPFNEIVAIKVLDLERCNNDLDGIRREVHTMSLINHPRLLRAHCSFNAGYSLWVVMPYMAGGSCLHVMKYSYPEGFEEPVIATLLRETLKALVYLHSHGHIHRDVKAGNILLSSDGSIKLADFGVSACMFDNGDRQRSRNTFVGTPCWMAPEVMQQLHGYDFKADIWSFGITALELAHRHAPFSKYPPMKVLLMTLQNAPPGLDYDRDKRFSKSLKELVAACLVKDPKKRPTSEKLMKHPFFNHACLNEDLAHRILDGLPPLGERCKILKAKESELLLHNKNLWRDKEQMSQQEYNRGISAWNFNLEDLKSQAALIPDDESVLSAENSDASIRQKEEPTAAERSSPDRTKHRIVEAIAGLDDLNSLAGSLGSFPTQPIGYFDVGEDHANSKDSSWKNATSSGGEEQTSPKADNQPTEKVNGENLSRSSSVPQFAYMGQQKVLSGPLVPENSSYYRKQAEGDRDREIRYSSPLSCQKKDANNYSSEDPPEGAVVKRKGWFQVTSADASPKAASINCYFNAYPGSSAGAGAPNVSAASMLPSLQCILQQNSMQREEILKLIKHVEQISGNAVESADGADSGLSQVAAAADAREGELLAELLQLQQSVGSLVDELQRQKLKNSMLERQLNAVVKRREWETDKLNQQQRESDAVHHQCLADGDDHILEIPYYSE